MTNKFHTSNLSADGTPFHRVDVLIFAIFLLFINLYKCHTVIAADAQGAVDASVNEANWSIDQRLLYYGIPVQVRFAPANPKLAETAWSYLEGIDAIFNDYKDDSEIGRINKAGAGTYTLSPSLAEAFALAVQLNRLTNGAFDITVGPLRRLYRQAAKDGQFPTPDAIAEIKKRIGPQTFTVNGNILTVLQPHVAFDFGGLIKGMAVDHVIGLLTQAGVSAALVQCGGETACFGHSPRGRPHRLGIPHPLDDEADWCVVGGKSSGFCGSTSSNALQPIVINEQRYYHVFDPRSGLPAATHVLSASVAFSSFGHNGKSDGLAKLGVIDPDHFLRVVQEQGGQGMVLIQLPNGSIEERHSPGWTAFVLNKTLTPTAPGQNP